MSKRAKCEELASSFSAGGIIKLERLWGVLLCCAAMVELSRLARETKGALLASLLQRTNWPLRKPRKPTATATGAERTSRLRRLTNENSNFLSQV